MEGQFMDDPMDKNLNIIQVENPCFKKIKRKRSQVKMACGIFKNNLIILYYIILYYIILYYIM